MHEWQRVCVKCINDAVFPAANKGCNEDVNFIRTLEGEEPAVDGFGDKCKPFCKNTVDGNHKEGDVDEGCSGGFPICVKDGVNLSGYNASGKACVKCVNTDDFRQDSGCSSMSPRCTLDDMMTDPAYDGKGDACSMNTAGSD